MGIFKNKKKKEEEKKKNQTLDFKVIIWEDVGFSVREVKTFQASRFIDEDKVPFIYNEEIKFMELYPQDIKDNVNLNEKEIIKKIEQWEKKLKEIRNKPIEDYGDDEPNTLDIEFKLSQLRAKQRGLQYSKSASYVNFDSKGQVCFNFLRKGNSFFPFKWDTDTSTIHTASEPVVKKAGILLRNKENKYLPKKIIETSTLILLAVVIIGTIANLFFGGWLWQKYDKSNLAADVRLTIETNNQCSEIIIGNAKALKTMQSEFIKEVTGKTTTNIQGLVPN